MNGFFSQPLNEWCYQQHKDTNHMYDRYLPYEFHLRMSEGVGEQFSYLLDDTLEYYTRKPLTGFNDPRDHTNYMSEKSAVKKALPGHDLIEDTRLTYNDVRDKLGYEAADIIYAVSNPKGRNRKERNSEEYYRGIRETRGAVFVKLCDRIANVQYSKMMGSRMFEMYLNENNAFLDGLFPEKTEALHTKYFEIIALLNRLLYEK